MKDPGVKQVVTAEECQLLLQVTVVTINGTPLEETDVLF
jgi:hypothetical protein